MNGVRVLVVFVLACYWVAEFACCLVKNLSSVGWYIVVGNVEVLCGIVHRAGNAILMRGGACAADLRLMELRVGSRCVMVCVFIL